MAGNICNEQNNVGSYQLSFSRVVHDSRVATPHCKRFRHSVYKQGIPRIQLGIKHTYTAPAHSVTNGAAENFVKTFKEKIKVLLREGNNVKQALQAFLF